MLVNYKNVYNFETTEYKVSSVGVKAVEVENLTDHLLGFQSTDYSDPAEDEYGPIGLKLVDDINTIKHGLIFAPHEIRRIEYSGDLFFDDPEVNKKSNQEEAKFELAMTLDLIEDCIEQLKDYKNGAVKSMKRASDKLIPDNIEEDLHEFDEAIDAADDLIESARKFYDLPVPEEDDEDDFDDDEFEPL